MVLITLFIRINIYNAHVPDLHTSALNIINKPSKEKITLCIVTKDVLGHQGKWDWIYIHVALMCALNVVQCAELGMTVHVLC